MIFDKFKELHIGVIGDLILDEYIYGNVNRLSPEAPIPIVDLTETEHKAGGAANVCLNLHNLGVKTSMIGIIGQDSNGKILKDLITSGVENANIELIEDPDRITTCKTRVVAHNQHIVRIDHEVQTPVNDKITDKILKTVSAIHLQSPMNAIILQDYEKGVFHQANIPVLIDHIKKLGIKIIVDPKDKNFWYYKGVDLIKPNKKEAEKALNSSIKINEQALADAAYAIESKLKNGATVITLSEHGVYIKLNQNNIWQRSEFLDVVDVCGAGDAVISVVAASYCAGLSVEEIASLSNLSGAIVCGVRGVAAVNFDQLKQAYLNRSN